MVDDRRDTVIVEKERGRSPLGWIVAVILIILLVLAFFYYGGFGLFGGATNEGGAGGSVNVTAPDTVNVQPSTGQ
jgi:hypothetical protein